MRRRVAAFAGSVLLHILLLAAATAWWRTSSTLLPEFVAGESSVALTLVAARPEPPEPPQTLPQPESFLDTLPELPDAVPLPDYPPPDETELEAPEPEPELAPEEAPDPEAAPPEASEADADLLSKGVEAPVFDIAGIKPRYPLGSRLRGEEGLVRLRAVIDASGRAVEVELLESSGYDALDREALRAARRARYVDAGGAPHAGETSFVVRFRLVD